MKIKRFQAKNVHGFLNFNIQFDSNLTFLIGINGSGKTSAIKLILGLLSPSWYYLTQIEYEYAEIECEEEGRIVLIRSENQDEEKIKLVASIGESQKSGIFKKVKISEILSGELTRFGLRQRFARFSRYEGHFGELDVVKAIRDLITPIYLGLDRRIYEGTDIDFLNVENLSTERDNGYAIKGNLHESLQEVENIIKNSFIDYSQKQSQISNDLKHKIIYSTFDIIESKSLDSSINPDIDIESRKQKILEASKNIEISGLENKITEYFTELRKIQEKVRAVSKSKDLSPDAEKQYLQFLGQFYINIPHLQRIDKIIQLYENAQAEILQAYAPFLKFEELASQFFKENGKTIKINNGLIEFVLPNGETGNIYDLSSGEKQILVMLATLLFGKHRQIFIIDEPEISLHLGWQEIFVPSIIHASPTTQFILATHSPTIIGSIENEIFCRDLSQNEHMYA